MKYIDPPNATAATLEVISVLETTGDPALARDFVAYVLSEEGQAIWGVRSEFRTPRVPTLYHYPIAPQIYEKYAEHLAVARNPMKESFGLKSDDVDPAVRPERLIPPLVQAACGGANHVKLQIAWRKLIDAGLPGERLDPLAALPFAETELPGVFQKLAKPDEAEAQAIVQSWTEEFARRFQ